jgi:hypothetical protein
MTTTWTPKFWTDTQHDMPNIPVVDGMTQHAYGESLPSFGESREDSSQTKGAGYGERISVVYDPATGNLGVVTQWEWNSPVLSYIWTAEGLDFHQHADPHSWMWDAVKGVRHSLAWYAFRAARRAGTTESYWRMP